jgi:hypothetical protein
MKIDPFGASPQKYRDGSRHKIISPLRAKGVTLVPFLTLELFLDSNSPPPEIAPILRFDHLEASPFVCLFGEMVRTAAVTWILASPYGCNELSFAFHLAGNQPAS